MPDLLDRLKAALADRYEIEKEIGRGGMATVFLAEDLKHHRQVAIKVLHPELAASVGTGRFLREIETVAGLRHPHILPLHDSGEADGLLYFVMPYVEGESLREHLERDKQLPLEEAIQIAHEVAGALDHAHRHEVVHRDIKPANILLDEGHAVVTDFGVARAVSEAGGENVTATGLAVGTPAYMSPEQAAGEEVDERSDIYALGCVLYEMLAGEPPLTGATPQSTAAKRLTDRPTPLAVMRSTVPEKLQSLVERTLATSAADRPGTARKLAEELAAVRRSPEPAARRSPAARWLLPAIGLAAIAVVAAVAWTLATDRSVTRDVSLLPAGADDPMANSIAVLPFVNMSDDASNEYFSDGISEELGGLLTKIPELRVTPRTSSFAFKGENLEIPEIARRLNVAYILDGSVRKAGNEVRINAQLIDARLDKSLWSETWSRTLDDIFEIQDEIAIAVVDALRISLLGEAPKTRRTDPQTYQLFLEGQYLRRQITDASLQRAIEAFKQAVEIDPTYVPAWAELIDTYLWLGENALADQAIQTAISIDPDYAYVYYVRGVWRIFSEFRFKAGIEDFQHALKLDPDDAFIIAGIGKGAFVTGDFDLAIQQFRAGLRVEPVVPEFYWFLGMAYRGAGRFDDAEASFRKMWSLSPQSRALGDALLWEALFLKGDLDAALAETEQQTSHVAKAASLAITHYALGNEVQSDSILADLIENEADYTTLAMVYGYRGEVDKAFEWLNRAQEADRGDLIFILSDRAFSSLHSDSRWQPFLKKMNLLEFWLEMPPEWGGPLD